MSTVRRDSGMLINHAYEAKLWKLSVKLWTLLVEHWKLLEDIQELEGDHSKPLEKLYELLEKPHAYLVVNWILPLRELKRTWMRYAKLMMVIFIKQRQKSVITLIWVKVKTWLSSDIPAGCNKVVRINAYEASLVSSEGALLCERIIASVSLVSAKSRVRLPNFILSR